MSGAVIVSQYVGEPRNQMVCESDTPSNSLLWYITFIANYCS